MASAAALTAGAFRDALGSSDPSRIHSTLSAVCAALEGADGGRRDALHFYDSPPATVISSAPYALLCEYFGASRDCEDLFQVWERQKAQWKFTGLTESILDTLRWIVTASGWDPAVRSNGIFLVKKIMAQHARSLYQSLSSDRARPAKAALRLLVAMVGQSVASARDVQQSFNFAYKPLEKLPTRRAAAGESPGDDVRTHFVAFALSFLRWEDSHLTKQVLEIKGFVPSVLRGLGADPPHVVSAVLDTLSSRVVKSHSVQKKVKIAFFNPSVLDLIARLYERPPSEGEGAADGDPRMDAHAFLLDLCCGADAWLSFPDPKWTAARQPVTGGAKGKTRNPTLLRFAQSLVTANEDLLVQELVLAILSRCPDIAQPYVSSVTLALEPRLSFRWLANASLLTKILGRTPHPPFVGKAAPRSPAAVLEHILPAVLTRQALTHGLQHASPLVRYTTLGLLVAVFAQADVVHADAVAASRDASPAQSQGWMAFFRQLREGLRRRLPDVQTVLARRQNDQPTDVDAPAQQQLSYARVLAVIRGYLRHAPEALIESRFDYGKLVPPLPVLLSLSSPSQLFLAEILAGAAGFKWQAKAVTSDAGQATRLSTHFAVLVYLGQATQADAVRGALRRFALSALADTGLFDGGASMRAELRLWVDALWASEDAIAFLDAAIAAAVKDPYPHIDAVADAFRRANEAQQDAAQAPPCSPLLASALTLAASDAATTRDARTYLRRVVVSVASTFPHTLPIELLVQKLCGDDLSRALCRTIASWSTGLSQTLPDVDKAAAKRLATADAAISRALAGDAGGGEALAEAVLDLPWPIVMHRLVPLSAALDAHANARCAFVRRLASVDCASSLFASADALGAIGGVEADEHAHLWRLLNELPYGVALSHCASRLLLARPPVLSYLMGALHHRCESVAMAFSHTLLLLSSVIESGTGSADDAMDGAVRSLYALLAEALSISAGSADASPASLMQLYASHAVVERHFFPDGPMDAVSVLVTCGSTLLATEFQSAHAQAHENDPALSVALAPLLARVQARISAAVSRCRAAADTGKKAKKDAGAQSDHVTRLLVSLLGVYRPLFAPADASRITLELLSLPSPAFGAGATAWSLLVLMLTRGDRDASASLDLSREGFAKLATLMRACPSAAIDSVVVDILAASTRRGVVGATDYAAVVGADLVSFCLSDGANSLRVQAAAILVRASPHARAAFEDVLLLDRKSGDSKALLATPTACVALASAYLESLGVSTDIQKDGGVTRSLSAHQRSVVRVLGDALVSVLVASLLRPSTATTAVEVGVAVGLVRAEPSYAVSLVCALVDSARASADWAVSASRVAGFAAALAVRSGMDGADSAAKLLIPALLSFLGGRMRADTDHDLAEEAAVGACESVLAVVSGGVLCSRDVEAQAKLFATAACRWRLDAAPVLTLVRRILSMEGASWAKGFASVALDTLTDARGFEDALVREDSAPVEDVLDDGGDDNNDDVPAAAGRRSRDGHEALPSAKEALVHLLSTLASLSPSDCCRAHLVPLLMSAYGASLSRCDRLLLGLLNAYEAAGISVGNEAFMFGTASLERRRERKELFSTGRGLSLRAIAHEFLESVDPARMAFTAENLPPSVEMSPTADVSADASVTRACYDPAFLLPLVAQVASVEDPPDCRRLLECDCLSVVIASLAVRSEAVRAAAYEALGLLYALVDSARFREKPQVYLLLSALKNGITGENERVPGVVAAFVCSCARILLRPDHFLYATVNKFVLQRPALDLRDVPLFFALFNSASGGGAHRKERAWMLRLLHAGIRDGFDRRIYTRRHVFELLLSFLDSPLSADGGARKAGVRVIERACGIPTVAEDLVRRLGLVPWFHAACASAHKHGEGLWRSLLPAAAVLVRTLARSGAMYLPEEFVWMARASIEWLATMPSTDPATVSAVVELVAGVMAFAHAHVSASYGPAATRASLFADVTVAHVAQLIALWRRYLAASPEDGAHVAVAGAILDIASSICVRGVQTGAAATDQPLGASFAVIEWCASTLCIHHSLGAGRIASFGTWCAATFARDRRLSSWVATTGMSSPAARALSSLYTAASRIDGPEKFAALSAINSVHMVLVARAREIASMCKVSQAVADAAASTPLVAAVASAGYASALSTSPDGAVVRLLSLAPHPFDAGDVESDIEPCTCGACGDSVKAAAELVALFVRELWSGSHAPVRFAECVAAVRASGKASGAPLCLVGLLSDV